MSGPVAIMERAALRLAPLWARLRTKFPSGRRAIPSDFMLIAASSNPWHPFGSGGHSHGTWRCTITADGKVARQFPRALTEIEAYEFPDALAPAPLSRADLKDLIAKIEEADFWALPDDLNLCGWGVEDAGTRRLTVTKDGKTHEVVFDGGARNENEELKRFLLVWSEVLKKVPPPKRRSPRRSTTGRRS